MARVLLEPDAGGDQPGDVAGKVVRMQEKPNPAACLKPDCGGLIGAVRPGQQNCRLSAGRGDHDPALVAAEIGIGAQIKPQLTDIKRDSGIVVRHDNGERMHMHGDLPAHAVWQLNPGDLFGDRGGRQRMLVRVILFGVV